MPCRFLLLFSIPCVAWCEPTAHWRFEAIGSAMDSSGNGAVLVPVGQVAFPVRRVVSPASAFPRYARGSGEINERLASFGGGHLAASSGAVPHPDSAFTLQFFLRATSMPGPTSTAMLASQFELDGDRRSWFVGLRDGQVRMSASGNGADFVAQNTSFSPPLEVGRDYAMAVVFDSGTASVYLRDLTGEGDLRTQTLTGFPPVLYHGQARFLLGAYDTGSLPFAGYLDEVSFHTHAQTMDTLLPVETETERDKDSRPTTHLAAESVAAPAVALPSGRRIPFGWTDFAVPVGSTGGRTILQWSSDFPLPEGELRMRLAVSLDIRETVQVEARDPETGKLMGIFDFTQAPVFQLGEIPLSRSAAERIRAVGVELVAVAGTASPRFFGPSPEVPMVLQPHILVANNSDRWLEFFERACRLDLIQTFSWMEGCLLDGVYDLQSTFNVPEYAAGLEQRLDLYLRGNDLIYENPRSQPVDNTIYGIEGTLPFAVIARLRPQHPSVQRAVNFWLSAVRPPGTFAAGSIQDGSLTSAEGSICVGYPLLVIARQRGDLDLEELGLAQFRVRQQLLVGNDGSIYLRNSNGSRSFRNWARGITWYFLGLVRGIIEVQDRTDIDDLRAEALRVMDYVLARQLENGLWTNFIHDPKTGVDTSGSAGIAAALALGHNAGILPIAARDAAVRARDALGAYLTPDGLLAGGTPSNRASQGSSERRVIFPVGMGLALQLLAALDEVTFPIWQLETFNAAERRNPEISGAYAVPGADGHANVIHYFQGSDPKSGTASQHETNSLSLRDDDVVFRYQRNSRAVEAEGWLEWSTDLQSWHTENVKTVVLPAEHPSPIQTWEAEIPLEDSDRIFLRLQIGRK